jgi:DNA anti-recombination protein RmuC
MIASLISFLPAILTALFFIVVTSIILKLWYSTRYIHRDEVRPLQESQHMMQNQYAILAERIKHTESQLIETKAKLEIALKEKENAILELKQFLAMSLTSQPDQITELKNIIDSLKTTLDSKAGSAIHEEDKSNRNEQVNLLRQNLKEFKTEISQKLNVSSNQFHELSNQLWILIDLNKKLNAETEQLNKLIQNPSLTPDEAKVADRQFTLASIKKRS